MAAPTPEQADLLQRGLETLLRSYDGDVAPAEAITLARALGPERAGRVVARILAAALDERGDGGRPCAAADLAGTLALDDAIPLLCRCVEELEIEDPLWGRALSALEDAGPAALEHALRAFRACRDRHGRSNLCDALVRLGVRDGRILAALDRMLEEDVGPTAENVMHYGDPAALPALCRALDRAKLDDDSFGLATNLHIFAIVDAIAALGGALTPAQEEKVAEARATGKDLEVVWARAKKLARKLNFPLEPVGKPKRPQSRRSRH